MADALPTDPISAVAGSATRLIEFGQAVFDADNKGDMVTAVERSEAAAFQAQLLAAQVACKADPGNPKKEAVLNALLGA